MAVENRAKERNGIGARGERVALWAMRIAFLAVFAVNLDCALSFIISPEAHMGAYGLSGVAGAAAVQGLGVAFLMWNVTYPAFILRPAKWSVLGWVVLVQQLVGLVGESLILAGLPAGHQVLAAGILRFIAFDGAGLVLMAATFALWLAIRKRNGNEVADA
ncbi:MAG: hypothetical protein IKF96_00700 [Eggerthellaceae bacterium]|nr:hypothetical protein [Eggerthellaceae bacterium]